MGKADASLPDPLTEPKPALAGTDDLLSQLAGDEIDRLLAEADVAGERATPGAGTSEADRAFDAHLAATAPRSEAGREALDLLDSVQQNADAVEKTVRALTPPSVAVAQPADKTASPSGGIDDELKALFAELNEPLPAADLPASTKTFTASSATEPDPATNASLSAEIDDLFKQLTADQPNTVASTPAPTADAATAALSDAEVADQLNAAAHAAAPVTDGDRATDPTMEPDAAAAMQERAGLGLAGLATSVAAGTAPPAALSATEATDDVDDADDAPLPMLLRPLEWMNAPLAGAGDSMRDLVGKAAIVTLVNAAAVLAYVMLFRR